MRSLILPLLVIVVISVVIIRSDMKPKEYYDAIPKDSLEYKIQQQCPHNSRCYSVCKQLVIQNRLLKMKEVK